MSWATQQAWRAFLEYEGPGPWSCHFCDEQVASLGGKKSKSGCVHHVDENKTNNSRGNLVAAHHGCHVRHHHVNKPLTAAHRAKISAGLVGAIRPPVSAETRAKLSAAHRGRVRGPLSAEHRAKIGAANKGRPPAPATRAAVAAANRKRKKVST